jgi:hypothetical protein
MNGQGVLMLAAVPGIASGVVCLIMLRAHSRREELQNAEAERRQSDADRRHTELQMFVQSQRDELSGQIAKLERSVEALETGSRSLEEVGRGLTRSRRGEAIQLLRSGISPEKAAASLCMPRNEMRLIAKVSRLLTPVDSDRGR